MSPYLNLAGTAVLILATPQSSAMQAEEARSPLAGLPSEAGAHVDRIRALGDNAWLDLGPPAADEQWGRARGRSWTAVMPLASRLRGAFLFGEGQHGYAKPNGHYMDDLWFYDINGHRWICCYPGANTKTLALKINPDGFEASQDGQPIPVASQVHGYSMNTYDSVRQRMLSMPNGHSYWKRAIPQRATWWKPPPDDASPWMYDALTGRWNRLRTGIRAPSSGHGDTLIYVPSLQQAVFIHHGDVWFYDCGKNSWKPAHAEGPPPPFGIDAVSCYDSKRERIYIGGGSYPVAPQDGHAFWVYDLKQNRWVDPQPEGKPVGGSNSFPTKNAVMVYDSVNDKVLLVFHSFHDDQPERLGVDVYDPNENSWAEQRMPVPKELGHNRQAKNGFYDPDLGVVFIHTAGDSRDDGRVWVYRYEANRLTEGER